MLQIIKRGKNRQQHQLGQQQKAEIRQNLRRENGHRLDGRHAQRHQRVVGLFARERRMQHQRARKQKRQPQQARGRSGAISAAVGSNVKLKSTSTISTKTSVVASSSRVRNSVRSSLASSVLRGAAASIGRLWPPQERYRAGHQRKRRAI